MRTIGFGIGMRAACPDCQGRGKRPEKICKECRGSGTKRSSETVSVKIPAGIDDGQSIRIAGGGQAGEHGGLPGDLYVRIQVVPDKRFKRHGYDIHTQAEVSFAQAALGDKIEVETVQGLLSLKIPPGTQSHSQFRLGDKGVPELNGRGHGDHYVEVIVKTPTQLSSKQKKILEEFDRE
jgi:molecular chaperone DnaJ